MKILVFSDIHGSVPAARHMARLNDELQPDHILLLGDILYHGPRNRLPEGYLPKETVEVLAVLAPKLTAVRGNCDSEVDATVLPFPLAASAWVVDGSLRIFATHGHVYNPGNLPSLREGDVLLYGHTHIPMANLHSATGVRLCNPGSLALPKEGHPHSYGLFDDGVFTVFTEAGEAYLQLDCN